MEYQKIDHYLALTIDDKYTNKTLSELLQDYHLSKKQIHELRMSHDVYLNQEKLSQQFTKVLKKGDILKLPVFNDESIDFIPQAIPLDILYEDEFLLVVNKQIGIEVHPDSKDGLNTLVNAVAYYYQKTNQKHRIRYIHRLDIDTTGIIIFVKNYFVQNLYDYLLMQKTIKRYYQAITESHPPKEKDRINKKIGRDRHHGKRRIISNTGVDALTQYEVMKTYPNYSLLHVELFTGRTHQIRVHLKSIGCPILGDELYGNPSPLINRQALHAYKVLLRHPVTLEPFMIEAPIPKDMKSLIK